jgi:DNA-binding CsgD family transcriptional regulator
MPSEMVSRRELEVIRLIGNGLTATEIGGVLHISEPTVNRHKANIYLNLNVRNENELIGRALGLKLINENELHFFAPDYVLKPMPEKQELQTIRRIK